MPRSFLVKRCRKQPSPSYRPPVSEDERSESGSEYETSQTHFGSPDSGYSRSPQPKEPESLPSTPASSPRSVSNIYSSPFQFPGFDQLAITSALSIPSPSSGLPSPHLGNLQIPQLNIPNPGQYPHLTIPLPLCGPSAPQLNIPSPALYRDRLKFLATPTSSPNKRRVESDKVQKPRPKKHKAIRKLNFDEDKTSPVSGTIIKDFSDSDDEGHVSGDIDSSLNFVEVTPEAKAELAKIENKIGDYVCQLCKEFYEDAFQLAQHRCSRIKHVEYRCPECNKVFNCPANLASHRRWHKPRNTPPKATKVELNEPQDLRVFSDSDNSLPPQEQEDGQFECPTCVKRFKKQSYLRKHMSVHVEGNYPCQYCGKLFRTESSRAKHVIQHTVDSNDYMCTVCMNCFPNKLALEKHVRIHVDQEIFSCKYCTASFFSSPGLTRHMSKCHPAESRQVILLQLPTMTRPC